MTPVFSFVAYSNTGKTTYIEKLIAELTRRGVRVAAIKHDAHEFEVDKPGKDSWRFGQAGAKVVAVASATKCAIMEYRPVSLDSILERIHDVDVIIAEGWHAESGNRVAVYRSDSGNPIKLQPEECVAVVSDVPLDTGATPQFPLDDPAPLADFIVAKIEV
jgi:molybdopterin-guanine dinucleotide biosynthesis protein B